MRLPRHVENMPRNDITVGIIVGVGFLVYGFWFLVKSKNTNAKMWGEMWE